MKLVKTASGKNKIKISKKEWVNIGKTKGWIRKLSSSYNNGRMEFTEGGSFSTPSGIVNVVEIDLETHLSKVVLGDNNFIMDLDTLKRVDDVDSYLINKMEDIRIKNEEESKKLEEDSKKQQDMVERKRIREEKKNIINNRFQDLDNFILTGFIASNGNISAQIPQDQLEKFEKEYKDIKGYLPSPVSFEIASAKSKWHRQYRIHIPKNKVDDYMLGVMGKMGLDPKETNSTYNINDTFYVKKILEMGFDFGKSNSSNVEKIESYINENYGEKAGEAFVSGYAY